MKLLHIADLHIGKRVNEFNMLEDQKYILEQLLLIIDAENPDCILIAGDVYDKSQPSAEAVDLLDDFLTELIACHQQVFMISGNHDSPERLEFGSRIMQKNGLHIAGVFKGRMHSEVLKDEHGAVNIYLLPYVKPAIVRPHTDRNIESYDDAVRAVIAASEIDTSQRNVLVAHQFVTSGAQQPYRSESESISVGGTDNIDVSAFDDFDYVALGHLHGPQKIGRNSVRYAGSPLKYSFSEARHQKSVTLLELGEKSDIHIRLLPLIPRHDMRRIKGPIAELLNTGRTGEESKDDYIHATVTDEDEIYDAVGQLRQVYPNLMTLDFENSRTRHKSSFCPDNSSATFGKTPLELFSEFYQMQNNSKLSSELLHITKHVLEQAGGNGI